MSPHKYYLTLVILLLIVAGSGCVSKTTQATSPEPTQKNYKQIVCINEKCPLYDPTNTLSYGNGRPIDIEVIFNGDGQIVEYVYLCNWCGAQWREKA